VNITRAYRFALDPAPEQERMLRSRAGAARFAWNWGLAKCQERYQDEGRWYSGAELHRLWNAEKKASPALAWWSENSKCAYQEAFRDLDRALRDFGGTVRPRPARHVPVKQEPGTADAGKTGTASRQREAAA